MDTNITKNVLVRYLPNYNYNIKSKFSNEIYNAARNIAIVRFLKSIIK